MFKLWPFDDLNNIIKEVGMESILDWVIIHHLFTLIRLSQFHMQFPLNNPTQGTDEETKGNKIELVESGS